MGKTPREDQELWKGLDGWKIPSSRIRELAHESREEGSMTKIIFEDISQRLPKEYPHITMCSVRGDASPFTCGFSLFTQDYITQLGAGWWEREYNSLRKHLGGFLCESKRLDVDPMLTRCSLRSPAA